MQHPQQDNGRLGNGSSLPALALSRLLQDGLISPWDIACVNEIADMAMHITEQAWLLDSLQQTRGVVVKSYRPRALGQQLKDLAREVRLLRTLSHRHLVSVLGMGAYNQHGTWQDLCDSLFLVEEYAGPMPVAKLIKGMATQASMPMHAFLCYNYWDALKWMEQLADCLAYLHSRGISHGDVSCRNLFFTTPDVHATDIRLGDLKPHRRSYVQRSSLLRKEGVQQHQQKGDEMQQKGDHQQHQQKGDEMPSAGTKQEAAKDSDEEYVVITNALVLPAISEDPALIASCRNVSKNGGGPQTSGYNSANHLKQPLLGPNSPSHSPPGCPSESRSESGKPMLIRRSKLQALRQGTLSEEGALQIQQLAHLTPAQQKQVATKMQDSRKTQELNARESAALASLLEQVAKDSPQAVHNGRPRTARASWSLGVGPTVRVGLPSLPDTHGYKQGLASQGLSDVSAARCLPAPSLHAPFHRPSHSNFRRATTALPSGQDAQHAATHTALEPAGSVANGQARMPTHYSSQLDLVDLASMEKSSLLAGAGEDSSAPCALTTGPNPIGVAQQELQSRPSSSHAGNMEHSPPPLAQMGSGFLMATCGTSLARAAKQQLEQLSVLSGQKASSLAMLAAVQGGKRDAQGRPLQSYQTSKMGNWDLIQRMPFRGDSVSSAFSWDVHAANMGLLTRLPNEAAPLAHHHGSGRKSSHEDAGGDVPFARNSYTNAKDYAAIWKGIDADVSVRGKFASKMKGQVDTAYDKSIRGANAYMKLQQQGKEGEEQKGAGQEQQQQQQHKGQQQERGSKPAPTKKSVRFAAKTAKGKLSGSDRALIHLPPEQLSAAVAKQEGAQPDVPIVPTPQADTFAFAKVMYQLLWRSLLEPKAPSAEEELAAIEDYARRIASGYRPQVPDYWPSPLTDLLQQCWAQCPDDRPSMATVKRQLSEMRCDARMRNQLAVADREHRLRVRPGESPDDVALKQPGESMCFCSIS